MSRMTRISTARSLFAAGIIAAAGLSAPAASHAAGRGTDPAMIVTPSP